MHHLSRRTFLKVAAPLLLSSFVAFPARAGQDRKSSILIVYFSMPETNSPGSMTREEDNSVVVIDGRVLGNTQYVAMLIQKMTGGRSLESNIQLVLNNARLGAKIACAMCDAQEESL